ncbi:hydrogenase maturation nickel metallochaperone HypA [Methylocaldum gracile]|jgi:hydrogenase nickel incorporation protein HypA/HybF|uniref:hydrogenase maturation nickel metallochaperone HypA n=1 Tax=unclassified Methylocaldum TaxID=2622260 RepID=UPI00105C16AA
MHELSLCQGIIDILETEASKQHFARVRKVRLLVGPLAGVDRATLSFGFDAVSRDTIAEGAELEFIDTPGLAWCFTCDRTVEIAHYYDPCPACGGHRLKVTGGEEFRILDLEVE